MYENRQLGVLTLGVLAGVAVLYILLGFSDPEARLLIYIAPVFGLLALTFGSLKVEVDSKELRFAFGLGWPRWTYKIEDIESVEAVRNRWFFGWGIRFTKYGRLYNVSGLEAVQVRLKDGKQFRVGTNEPKELVRALERRLADSNRER